MVWSWLVVLLHHLCCVCFFLEILTTTHNTHATTCHRSNSTPSSPAALSSLISDTLLTAMLDAKYYVLALLSSCIPAMAVNSSYGVDVSFPIHHKS
eukprot:scaffold15119_cov63-Cyclotella_meneghiniana.AAC.8